MEKELTVVIPVYNAEKFLDRCLKSLLDQTLFRGSDSSYILYLIDDGSTDRSLQILTKYKLLYPDMVVVEHQTNSGIAYSRNKGIRKCATKYIAFVDNDDYVDDDYLEILLTTIKETDADIALCGYRRENSKGEVVESFKPVVHDWSKYRCITPWGRIFKTSLLKDNRICFFNNNIGEDIMFSLKVYSVAKNLQIINYDGYIWFFNEESVSNTLHKGLNPECNFDFLLKEAASAVSVKDDLGCYFLNKLVVWYLLFSGKTASPQRFGEVAQDLFRWLFENGYRSSIPFFSKKIRSEPLRNKIAISFLNMVYKLGLIKLFALIYCNKKLSI